MMIVAPIFSAPGFNLRARVLLSVLVAALVAPSMQMPNSFDLMSTFGLLVSLQEIAVGLMIGFTLQIAF
jgi:flagellar biosynthetic protein FliR